MIASLVGAGWPLLLQGWLHLMMVIARLQLGRWPNTQGADDPKHIAVISVMHGLLGLGLLLTILAVPIGFGMMLAITTIRPRRGLVMLPVGAALCAGGILIGDPVNAWTWFWD